MTNIAILGEVMLEFSSTSERNYVLGISGDTYNTACTLAGLNISVTYITSLGEGQPAAIIRQDAQQRNVQILEPNSAFNKSAGLYIVYNDKDGERSFNYWRDDSAAKALFNNQDLLLPLLNQVKNHDYLYFSGITLALINTSNASIFIRFLEHYRQLGGKVIFDPNYRPSLWLNQAAATQAIKGILPHVDIYLPGYEEEEILFACTSSKDIFERLLAIDISETVIKNGSRNCSIIYNHCLTTVSITPSKNVIDTTGAGDTFNGGYIGARLAGLTPYDAVNFAAKAASQILLIKGGGLSTPHLSKLNKHLQIIQQQQSN
ncbi:2-dehydro-3-deoxygluconokinase [Glaciecola punicea ACAM 611]|uniref:2-dehydro-3-deoxygluconokinase n=1 Tax=Glaciecola punicea ACAM 611 TaxID=1121923 RepID=H5TE88_9ALTE|nr:sugar kinase [Glaciecola punicea]GAB56615.1 2-dehydro-3-deoxygluconokinase [Glaciecola punicea ACAM 611]